MNQDDLQVWLLLNSLFFLSTLFINRIGNSFTQAIAFSVKGNSRVAIDLGKEGDNFKGTYHQNEIYNTCRHVLKYTSYIIGIIFFFVSIFIIEEKQGTYLRYLPEVIIVTFVVYTSCKFSYFSIKLNGNDKISIINNIGAIVSLLSVIGSVSVLLLTKNLMFLIIFYFIPNLIGIIFHLFYTKSCFREESEYNSIHFNKNVFKDLLKPISFGLIISFADQALLHLVTIYQYNQLSGSEFSSFLLTTRIVGSLSQFSFGILTCQRAYFATLVGSGEKELAIKQYIKKSLLSLFLFCLSLNFIYLFSFELLSLINSKTYLLDKNILSLLFSFCILNFAINCMGNFTTICNHIVFVKRSLFSLGIVLTSLTLFNFSLYFTVIILYLPRIIFINFQFVNYLTTPSMSFPKIILFYSIVILPFIVFYFTSYL